MAVNLLPLKNSTSVYICRPSFHKHTCSASLFTNPAGPCFFFFLRELAIEIWPFGQTRVLLSCCWPSSEEKQPFAGMLLLKLQQKTGRSRWVLWDKNWIFVTFVPKLSTQHSQNLQTNFTGFLGLRAVGFMPWICPLDTRWSETWEFIQINVK